MASHSVSDGAVLELLEEGISVQFIRTSETEYTSRRNVQAGDIVILMDSAVSRMEWPLAIVVNVEAQQDDDGLVRRVKVRRSTPSLDKDGKLVKKFSVLSVLLFL